MSEMVQVKCPKCGNEMRMHQPIVVRIDNGYMSQITLIPSWSPDERVCRSCGSVVSAIFGSQLPTAWVAMEPEPIPEEKRIVAPNMALPVDFAKRLKPPTR